MEHKPEATASRLDVVVLGACGLELQIALPKPFEGSAEILEGDSLQCTLGGRAGSQALAAARLGARVGLIARAGDDLAGREAVRALQREGVDTRHVSLIPDRSTELLLLTRNESGARRGARVQATCEGVPREQIQAARELISHASVFLTELEAPLDSVIAAVEIALLAHATVVLDPSPPRELPDSLLRRVDVLRLSSSEAEILTGTAVRDRDSARQAASELIRRGARAVVLEAGMAGNLLLSADHEVFLPLLRVDPVNLAGAGDAFSAALAVALAEGKSLQEAAFFGSAAAAARIAGAGEEFGPPHRSSVLGLLRRQASRSKEPGAVA